MDAAKRLGRLFDKALSLKLFKDAAYHVFANLAVGILAAAELQRQFDLAPFAKEASYLLHLVVKVIRVGSGMEFYLLNLLNLLGLTRLFGLNGLFVLELTIVHYLAHGRHGIGSNLHKIKAPLIREPHCFARRHDAKHASRRIKNAHLRSAYLEIYTSELCDKSPLCFS